MRLIICLALVLYSSLSWADKLKRIEALNHVYSVNEFRLFYTLDGDDALVEKNQVDANHNNVPDFIEAVAEQLKTAVIFYTKVLGLTHPLLAKRYKDKVQFIHVHIVTLQHNGSAGDAIVNLQYPLLATESNKALTIKLSNRLNLGNLTPAHELFHLFQNGYALFKNRWYTEGTARWAEYAFKQGVGETGSLPASANELNLILHESYQAQTFWNRLAALCDQNAGVFVLPKMLNQQSSFIPSPFQDQTLVGISFMKQFLESLGHFSQVASSDRGIEPFDWREEDQQGRKEGHDNNDYILCAVRQAVEKTCSRQTIQTPEVLSFLNTLKNIQHCKISDF